MTTKATKRETHRVRFTAGSHGKTGKLHLDGVDISRFTRNVSIVADANEINLVKIVVMANADFRLTAKLEATVIAWPGFDLVQEPQADGTIVYRSVPSRAKTP